MLGTELLVFEVLGSESVKGKMLLVDQKGDSHSSSK